LTRLKSVLKDSLIQQVKLMPYCQKCGAKLADDVQYCYNCGALVAAPTTQLQRTCENSSRPPIHKNPRFIPVIVITIIALSALVIAVVALAPLNTVNFNEQNQIGPVGLNKLNLDFHADVGDIYIYTNLTGDDMIQMDVSATGSTNIFSSDQPVKFNVQNSTANDTQMVTATVSSQNIFPLSENLHVICNIYINPKADLTLNVHSDVGKVYMEAGSDTKISSLTLEVTTGNTNLNLQKGTIVKGDLRVSTVTGIVWFSMDQVDINKNVTLNLNSGVGSVEMIINQTQTFNGNLQVNAHTSTGNVNLNQMLIDNEVAARIQSSTGLGEIHVSMQNFNGLPSQIQSNNFPSKCNINMNLDTGVGNINLKATYQTLIEPALRV